MGNMSNAVPKVWGQEIWIVNSPLYCGKRLEIKAGWRCSMHMHEIKDETFYLMSGKVLLELGDIDEADRMEVIMEPGSIAHILPHTWHRFSGIEDSVIFEFSTQHLDEDNYRRELSGPSPRQKVRHESQRHIRQSRLR